MKKVDKSGRLRVFNDVELVSRMNRILIVYDSKGGSTGEIIDWIRDGAAMTGASVDTRTVSDVDSVDYDIIAAGTPIYGGQPMDSIISFLSREDLKDKSIVLFVVCFAGVFGMRNFMVRRYLDELESLCAGHVIMETSFDAARGPWRKLNREICFDFGKDLAGQPATRQAVVNTT